MFVTHIGTTYYDGSLRFLAVAIMLVNTGCGLVRPVAPDQRGATQFERATTAYIEGRYVDAQRDFEEYSYVYPRAHKVAAAIYWDGMSLLALKHNTKARRRFQQAARQTSDRHLRAQAMLGEAWTLFLAGRLQAAETLYGRLRRTYRDEYIRYCESTPRWIPRLKPD